VPTGGLCYVPVPFFKSGQIPVQDTDYDARPIPAAHPATVLPLWLVLTAAPLKTCAHPNTQFFCTRDRRLPDPQLSPFVFQDPVSHSGLSFRGKYSVPYEGSADLVFFL